MLVGSLKVPPSLYLFLAFFVFLGYHFSHTVPPPDSPSPPPPEGQAHRENGPRIALVTFVTEERSYVHLSLRNKDHYARRHSLDLIVDYEAHPEHGTTWWKYDMMERLVKQRRWDWIWWLDFDTLITNTDVKVSDIIAETLANSTSPDEIDWLLTHDCNGLNAGSFIMRSHERSVSFMHDIRAIEARERERGENLSEQDAMATLIRDDPVSGHRTVQVPQWKLNAFPEEIACYDESQRPWEADTFVVHFAGAWAHVKGDDPTGQLMKKYGPQIKWGEWQDIYQ